MASFSAAAKSLFRSTSVRNATARLSSQAKTATSATGSTFRASSVKQPSAFTFRYRGISSSVFVETMVPFHTATASAVLNSLLSTSCSCRLPEGRVKTR